MVDYFKVTVGVDNKKEHRSENDFYPTPPIGVFALNRYFDIPDIIWEPAAGKGIMSREFERLGHEVISTDLYEYDPLTPVSFGVDFLTADLPRGIRSIVTNPPYNNRLAERFVLRALEHEVDFVAILARLQFLTSSGRYARLFSKRPPSNILAFPFRLNCNIISATSENVNDQIGGMLEYAWYVWKRDEIGTKLEWVDVDLIEEYRRSKE